MGVADLLWSQVGLAQERGQRETGLARVRAGQAGDGSFGVRDSTCVRRHASSDMRMSALIDRERRRERWPMAVRGKHNWPRLTRQAGASVRNLRAAMSGSPKVVAFVDDDPGARKAFKRLLSACGYQVLVYGSAERFLACPAALGRVLPGRGHQSRRRHVGHRARQDARARRSGARTPIIFMTASDDPWRGAKAIELGCVAYLESRFRPKSSTRPS